MAYNKHGMECAHHCANDEYMRRDLVSRHFCLKSIARLLFIAMHCVFRALTASPQPPQYQFDLSRDNRYI